MKVVLLCAGYGTRLRPLTENQPKPLLSVAGRPLLDHLLRKIEEIPSVDRVFVVTNGRFHSHFSEWLAKKQTPADGIELVNDGTRTEEERLGAIGDLGLIRRKFEIQDDLAVLAGDNLFDFSLKDFFRFAESRRPHVSLGVVDVRDRERASRYGIVRIGQDGKIAEFVEKPKAPPSTLASTGIYWFARESLDLLDRYIRESDNADRIGDFIHWLVKEDAVYAYPFEGKWLDIGDFDTYREAERLFSKTPVRQTRIRKGSS